MTMPRETAEFLVDQAISNLNNGLTKECRERILKAFIALAECIAGEAIERHKRMTDHGMERGYK